MAEFFVLRGCRRHRIGTFAAQEVRRRFPGLWRFESCNPILRRRLSGSGRFQILLVSRFSPSASRKMTDPGNTSPLITADMPTLSSCRSNPNCGAVSLKTRYRQVQPPDRGEIASQLDGIFFALENTSRRGLFNRNQLRRVSQNSPFGTKRFRL
jgi:hypothetical protein